MYHGMRESGVKRRHDIVGHLLGLVSNNAGTSWN